ncbi:MAG: ABC transporter permease subunit, partial [Lacticaseibacillus paracasei]|nr:ABC transporter permease subunit [Lacticaseibacillus paracasei]
MTIFWQDWQQIIPSVWTSIYIALLAILFGIPIGCLIAWIRVKRPPILNQLVGIYLSFARSVPMIVVLYILYFALPNLTTVLNGGKGLHIPATVVAVAALALFSSAYFGETFRAAYQALDPAQLEAALASGLSKRTAMKRIVLPQAAALALPNVFNSVMDIVKGT